MKLYLALLLTVTFSMVASYEEDLTAQLSQFETAEQADKFLVNIHEVEEKLKDFIHKYGPQAWNFIHCMVRIMLSLIKMES